VNTEGAAILAVDGQLLAVPTKAGDGRMKQKVSRGTATGAPYDIRAHEPNREDASAAQQRFERLPEVFDFRKFGHASLDLQTKRRPDAEPRRANGLYSAAERRRRRRDTPQPEQVSAMTDPLARPIVPQASDPESSAREVNAAYDRIKSEVHKVIVGQDQVVDELLTAIICGGHALVVGVPGLAKTLLISTLARTMSLGFSRIQFTPDLMPSDMTGTEVIEEDKSTGARALRFVKGPIFSNVILADEINRTPPKTQAALLEAMQERQVTAGGVRHPLPAPFFVLATQNPIEQEGTYPLPEAQLDRFMFNIRIEYPTEAQELEIVQRTTALDEAHVSPLITGDDVLRVQAMVRQVPVADHVVRYALRLVRATRVHEDGEKPAVIENYVSWGAGPRASQYLVLAAKARAILSGATHVMPEHIESAALPVLRHRVITNFNAEADGVTTDDIVRSLLDSIPVDSADAATRRQMDAVMR
jgi:MoxR-like ATPase